MDVISCEKPGSAVLGGARGAGTASPRWASTRRQRQRSTRSLTAGPEGLPTATIVEREAQRGSAVSGPRARVIQRSAEAVKLRVRSVYTGFRFLG